MKGLIICDDYIITSSQGMGKIMVILNFKHFYLIIFPFLKKGNLKKIAVLLSNKVYAFSTRK